MINKIFSTAIIVLIFVIFIFDLLKKVEQLILKKVAKYYGVIWQVGEMLRGSSFLLWKNPAYLKDLVEWIYEQPLSSWDIDVDDYKESSQTVLDLYNAAEKCMLKGKNHQAVTLVTKVLLGVFAIIPAYDRFFRDSFSDIAGNKCGFNTLNKKSLEIIYQFYIENKEEIEKLSNETLLKSKNN